MSEREIRAKLRRLCVELDRRVADTNPIAVAGVLGPLVLSAGLALSGCGDDIETVPGVGDGGSGNAAAWGGTGGAYGIGGDGLAAPLYGISGGDPGGWGGNGDLYGIGAWGGVGGVYGIGGDGGLGGTGGSGGSGGS